MPEAEAKKNNKGLIIGIIAGAVAVIAAVVVILIIILGGSPSLEGKWHIVGAKEGDIELGMDKLAGLGMEDYALEFKGDGKAVMTIPVQGEMNVTYDAEKKTITDAAGKSMDYKIEGKQLYVGDDGEIWMIFEK